MTTVFHASTSFQHLNFTFEENSAQCIKDFQLPYLDGTIHTSLQVTNVQEPVVSEQVKVTVFNASNGKMLPLILNNTDTVGKLKQMYLKMRPELLSTLNLAFNGKPVSDKKTLHDLGVKNNGMFITFQKCTGG